MEFPKSPLRGKKSCFARRGARWLTDFRSEIRERPIASISTHAALIVTLFRHKRSTLSDIFHLIYIRKLSTTFKLVGVGERDKIYLADNISERKNSREATLVVLS